jgi:hypothetical protein
MNQSEPGRIGPEGPIDRWEVEMWSILTPLMVAQNSALWLSTPEAALAASDQFRAIARDSTKWLLNHHCPIPDLAVSFTRLLRSSIVLADLLLEQAQNPRGTDWPAVTREVTGFHQSFEQFLSLLRNRSNQLPSDPSN